MDYNSKEYLEGLTDDDGEIRELTAEDFAQFRPIREFPEMYAFLTGLKRPEEKPVPLDIAPDVVRAFQKRGSGTDVQEQVNGALREWLREHAA